MSKLPETLIQKQELQRQKSINLVLHAISELSDEGHTIRIKDLMEHTGLSRSIFAKDHIRKILIDKGVCTESENTKVHKSPLNKSARIKKLEIKLQEKNERIQKLMEENDSLKEECALLRGKLFLLMQR